MLVAILSVFQYKNRQNRVIKALSNKLFNLATKTVHEKKDQKNSELKNKLLILQWLLNLYGTFSALGPICYTEAPALFVS